ncbi:MAG: CaiB/BaiF CoA-transferase family protein [Polaromonas sp.]|uniref:CaiB/BaiF CoA transferase family protein n=1 Tax=Polaromonas sp. TaxID=1869339 RepID=UPI002489C557|nr:CaiB/BaiF CoA-transferase family protein [Polaromonas sp.]MDI1240025.1 CaiB/BaiF CoA-transferase family protein [Polaromonas sp.]
MTSSSNPSSSLSNGASGPLRGVRVVEFSGLGPGPFACMLLSDMGAEVIRIDRPGAPQTDPRDITGRGRKTVLLDLKDPRSIAQVLDILAHADMLVEGFRPGVMERLGLSPQAVAYRNPRLIYGRMTGWGQDGPLALAAGHDINYIAITGALAAIGESGRGPVPPLNLVGDYGGGSLYLVMGLLAALLEARASGRGQVVDAAICDGALSLMSNNQSHRLRGLYEDRRGSNMLDGGAPYYTTYETSDAQYVSIGPIEPKFFALMCRMIDLPPALWDAQNDRTRWHALRDAMAAIFRTRSRAQWCDQLEGTDICFAPVLTLGEAAEHPHLRARGGFVEVAGVQQPAPAPRFSRTPSAVQGPFAEAEVTPQQLVEAWLQG